MASAPTQVTFGEHKKLQLLTESGIFNGELQAFLDRNGLNKQVPHIPHFLSEHAALCPCRLFIHAMRRAGNCFWFPLSACSRLANPRCSTTCSTQTSGGGAAPLPEAMQCRRALTYCLQHNELGGGPKKDNKRSHRTRMFVTMNFIFDRT